MNTSLKNKKPLLIGLTGGIGSGKTTVAKIFEVMNYPVFNSDLEAKIIVDNSDEVKQKIKAEFGNVYHNGILDRVKMAEIVFNDIAALEKLNSIVHPAVAKKFKNWIIEHQHYDILFKEAAILIESGAYQQMDKIVLVTASERTRIKRVMLRDKVSEDKVKERMSKQLSDKEKNQYADFLIENDSDSLVIPQILKIIEQLKSPSN